MLLEHEKLFIFKFVRFMPNTKIRNLCQSEKQQTKEVLKIGNF